MVMYLGRFVTSMLGISFHCTATLGWYALYCLVLELLLVHLISISRIRIKLKHLKLVHFFLPLGKYTFILLLLEDDIVDCGMRDEVGSSENKFELSSWLSVQKKMLKKNKGQLMIYDNKQKEPSVQFATRH